MMWLDCPAALYRLAAVWMRRFAVLAAAALGCGLTLGLLVVPDDALNGATARILFVHVPALWVSLLLYLVLLFWAGVGLISGSRLAPILAYSVVPTGALMTFIALWTGALWDKPTSGAWWQWDLRLTAEVSLLLLYLAFLALHALIDETRRADRISAAVVLSGSAIIPLAIYLLPSMGAVPPFAPGAVRASAFSGWILSAVVLTALGLLLYSGVTALMRARTLILERERDAEWIAGVLGGVR